ncbi:hypothetical protein AcW1_001985 [Taiwanofungus camphoratus]|nr:hypothetical protein AcW1_001985 [Antrodia cinnamomea]
MPRCFVLSRSGQTWRISWNTNHLLLKASQRDSLIVEQQMRCKFSPAAFMSDTVLPCVHRLSGEVRQSPQSQLDIVHCSPNWC